MDPKKTILVADDEQPIREFLQRILSKEGFHVLEASNGEEALDVFKRQTGNIHLVVMDISMPRMDGTACARLMLKEQPHIPIIYMSGNMDPALMPAELKNPAMAFLPKPFTTEEILFQVCGLLNAP